MAEFPVGEETYAIPLDALRAAVPLRMVTPVPLSPPHVIGILRFLEQQQRAHAATLLRPSMCGLSAPFQAGPILGGEFESRRPSPPAASQAVAR